MASKMELKPSVEWYPIIQQEYIEKKRQEIIIYDPDGWDRRNYQFSWYEELISKEEFENRLLGCTVMIKFLDEEESTI